MSISSISGTNGYQASQISWQNNLAQRQQDFKNLASALQSGNLSGAQSAFAVLQQSLPNLTAGNQAQNGQQGSGQNQFATDFSALGQALKANNLKGAQDAFAKLVQDMQSVKGHHRQHHRASPSTQSTASATSSASIGSIAGSSGSIQNASGSSSFSVYV